MADRRRGIAALLSSVASALPGCREARVLRRRFEGELGELLNAREVELRDGPAMGRTPESTISLDVTAGDFTLGAIDAESGVTYRAALAFSELCEWIREAVTPAVHDLHASAAASPSGTEPTGEVLPALVVLPHRRV